MKKIDHEEMFGSIKDFLKAKGIDLQEGAYTQRIRQGCGLLTDSINLGQKAWGKAKSAMDEQLEHLRQTIHEQTAPKPPPATARKGQASASKKNTAGKASAKRRHQKRPPPKSKA